MFELFRSIAFGSLIGTNLGLPLEPPLEVPFMFNEVSSSHNRVFSVSKIPDSRSYQILPCLSCIVLNLGSILMAILYCSTYPYLFFDLPKETLASRTLNGASEIDVVLLGVMERL